MWPVRLIANFWKLCPFPPRLFRPSSRSRSAPCHSGRWSVASGEGAHPLPFSTTTCTLLSFFLSLSFGGLDPEVAHPKPYVILLSGFYATGWRISSAQASPSPVRAVLVVLELGRKLPLLVFLCLVVSDGVWSLSRSCVALVVASGDGGLLQALLVFSAEEYRVQRRSASSQAVLWSAGWVRAVLGCSTWIQPCNSTSASLQILALSRSSSLSWWRRCFPRRWWALPPTPLLNQMFPVVVSTLITSLAGAPPPPVAVYFFPFSWKPSDVLPT